MQRALFYAKHLDKLTSPEHNLLVFQLRTNIPRDQGLLGSGCHNFRHLQHFCSSLAAVLLTCLKDNAQTYPLHCFITFLKYVLLSYFYHSKSNVFRTRRIQPLRKFECSLWEKRLTHFVHCTESRIVLKMGQENLYPPTVSPTPTFGQV